jgi:probable F420-dependent oxidoreductase
VKFYVSSAFLNTPDIIEIAKAADELGYDGLGIPDHVVNLETLQTPYPYTKDGSRRWQPFTDWPDPWVLVGALAQVTTRLKFVTTVYIPAMRNPYSAAKAIGTAALLASGRIELGIGVGWCREEFEAIGAAPFDDRGAVTDEWMMACRELWSAEAPKFAGKYVNFDDVVFTPKPAQVPIPIWVGGESAPALRRTVRYAQGWYPVGTNAQHPMNTVSTFQRGLDRFHEFCKRGNRDPKEITLAYRVLTGPGMRPRGDIAGEPELFSGGDADWVGDIKRLQEFGVTSIDVRLFGYGAAQTLQGTIDNMHRFRDGVLSKLA